ncbi:MAG: hypothetical protein WBL20_09550 [Sphingobium sp.]|uniref:hypothetical protein n=1 Tax=Sphingobium sp. TaxID=1912891 RepID=UPI003BAE2EA0
MSTEPSSLEKSFRAVTGESITAGVEPEQLDLLRDKHGRLPSNVFQQLRQRGRGRPTGARNKRTDDLARLVAQQHGDPVLFMASLYSTPLDQLVELMIAADPGGKSQKIGDITAKALGIQLAAAKSVSEYVHSKKPVQAEVKVGVDGVIVMPGAQVLGQNPVDQVMGRIADALNSGQIDPAQLRDMRIVDGEFAELPDDDGEDDDA